MLQAATNNLMGMPHFFFFFFYIGYLLFHSPNYLYYISHIVISHNYIHNYWTTGHNVIVPFKPVVIKS